MHPLADSRPEKELDFEFQRFGTSKSAVSSEPSYPSSSYPLKCGLKSKNLKLDQWVPSSRWPLEVGTVRILPSSDVTASVVMVAKLRTACLPPMGSGWRV